LTESDSRMAHLLRSKTFDFVFRKIRLGSARKSLATH
jgi:hypothetical protein